MKKFRFGFFVSVLASMALINAAYAQSTSGGQVGTGATGQVGAGATGQVGAGATGQVGAGATGQVGTSPLQPGISTTQPGISTTQPGISTRQRGVPITHPEISTTVPGIPPTQPAISPRQGGVPITHPGISTTVPGIPPTQPGISTMRPRISTVQPGVAPGFQQGVPRTTDRRNQLDGPTMRSGPVGQGNLLIDRFGRVVDRRTLGNTPGLQPGAASGAAVGAPAGTVRGEGFAEGQINRTDPRFQTRDRFPTRTGRPVPGVGDTTPIAGDSLFERDADFGMHDQEWDWNLWDEGRQEQFFGLDGVWEDRF